MARVALIGRRLEHNENLGLAYLAAALEQAGFVAERHYVNDAAELERAVTALIDRPPAVVGLSLADGGSAILQLAVGEALSQAGFRGHLTAGGQFATLAREWLLERHPWLDSVVRFAGEGPLVEIARRVVASARVDGTPGVTTRAGDGAPADVLQDAPQRIRPRRDELPEILGHKAAHMAASRGCLGRCQYCGPAALHTQERREGVRAGVSRGELTRAGVGGVRRREIDAVCDEMAELWHTRGVRYFYFVDEHLLPYTEPEALDYLRAWKEGLERRDVGAFGIGTMLRADRITPAVVDAFADLGLVRAFIGLELATAEEGRRFGRPPPGEPELALLDQLAERGVVTVSNLMLVHPHSTPESIARGIELLERVPRGVFEATRMMPYHGTRLTRTLQEAGRLIGNPHRYGYTFEDPRVERFAEIFMRLRAEAFWDYSVAFRTHDAFLALGLARRLHGERVDETWVRRLERARAQVGRLYVAAYRRALDLALSGGGFDAAGALVRDLSPRVAEIEAELAQIEAKLAAVGARRAFAPMRAAAASMVTFVLSAACARDTSPPDVPPPPAAATVDGGAEPVPDATVPVHVIADASVSEAERVLPDAALPVCTAAERDELERGTAVTVAGVDACFSGQIRLDTPPQAFRAGGGFGALCHLERHGDVKKVEQAAARFGGKCTDPRGRPVAVSVAGASEVDAQRASRAIAACRTTQIHPTVRVVLDAKGRVQRVDGGKPALAQCIRRVLAGLSFPCLASFDVCPEHVIIE
ncbi:MAG: cobalamin B12-binding domain-containing protein [Myxococcales bacterium]|nr:cobalamin B12-binding domain-containing protein [Myxococcales bacterium]